MKAVSEREKHAKESGESAPGEGEEEEEKVGHGGRLGGWGLVLAVGLSCLWYGAWVLGNPGTWVLGAR